MSGRGYIELDIWPRVRKAIEDRREDTLEAFLRANDWNAVLRGQSWIECLDWVLAEARPKPEIEEEE